MPPCMLVHEEESVGTNGFQHLAPLRKLIKPDLLINLLIIQQIRPGRDRILTENNLGLHVRNALEHGSHSHLMHKRYFALPGVFRFFDRKPVITTDVARVESRLRLVPDE